MDASRHSRKQINQHNVAKAAYRMKQKGHTTREIASQLGLDASAVKARVQLGERLVSEEETENG